MKSILVNKKEDQLIVCVLEDEKDKFRWSIILGWTKALQWGHFVGISNSISLLDSILDSLVLKFFT